MGWKVGGGSSQGSAEEPLKARTECRAAVALVAPGEQVCSAQAWHTLGREPLPAARRQGTQEQWEARLKLVLLRAKPGRAPSCHGFRNLMPKNTSERRRVGRRPGCLATITQPPL